MNNKVSLIIPVYNMEKYLERCLDSVVEQSFSDFEVIIVNDGSTDNSQHIINRYERKYPKKIKSFTKKNGGLSDARNYGIHKAKCDYIMFLDSDDWIDREMIKDMYDKIEEGFDIVCCDTLECYCDHKRNRIISCGLEKDIIKLNENKWVFTNFFPTAWNKIYKKSIFIDNDLFYKEKVWFEDVEMLYRMLPYINSIGVVKKPYYFYYQRIGAISKSFDERISHYINNMNGVVEYYKDKGFYDKYKYELEYSYVRYLYATMLKSAARNANKRKDFHKYKMLLKEAIENVKKTFPNYRGNFYLRGNLKGFYLFSFNYYVGVLLFWITPKLK